MIKELQKVNEIFTLIKSWPLLKSPIFVHNGPRKQSSLPIGFRFREINGEISNYAFEEKSFRAAKKSFVR